MKKQNKKKIIITVTAVVLVVAIGLGVWFGVSRGTGDRRWKRNLSCCH